MRTVDLFSGCGGMSLGFQSAGYNIVAAFENWPAAIECYKQNFKHPVIETDLSIVDEAIIRIKKYQPDLIIGGPPCQDFSNAGNRTEGERAELTHSFAKIITAVKPKFFVMENVPSYCINALLCLITFLKQGKESLAIMCLHIYTILWEGIFLRISTIGQYIRFNFRHIKP